MCVCVLWHASHYYFGHAYIIDRCTHEKLFALLRDMKLQYVIQVLYTIKQSNII